MLKRTLYFGNPAYLRKESAQLVVQYPGKEEHRSVPIEDLGIVVLDHPQITVTQSLLSTMLDQKIAIVWCDAKHLPSGLMLPMAGHHLHAARINIQASVSLPLKKRLWQLTVANKIANQAGLLRKLSKRAPVLERMADLVKSGDPENLEGQAANLYWQNLFGDFNRGRYEDPPNHLLNYGYAILRSVIARSLVSTGLHPALGIFHRNQYNPYCLADDIMEPYRPFVDELVYRVWVSEDQQPDTLSTEIKKVLLQIPAIDVLIEGKMSPLMVAAQRTAAGLAACFEGDMRKIPYPVIQ